MALTFSETATIDFGRGGFCVAAKSAEGLTVSVAAAIADFLRNDLLDTDQRKEFCLSLRFISSLLL